MKFYAKEYPNMLAICDENILGQTFEEGNKQITVREGFYNGALVGDDECIALMEKHDNINIVGENIVTLAESKGLVGVHDSILATKYAMIFKW